ncbi:hypothetical protein GGX14DRAFT_350292 [Mycena pura]|uniref:Uncharacterized protein n=1 Tax=Mycena pura TaxID=153505 RepID=A0AAD6YQC8_9AGAR|nr:hypothetical protein GGX14DRAFT_350292 [Mycena pura]
MHQTHNIAWDSLSSNLVFIHENPKLTPRQTDLFPRYLPSQQSSLSHFARTVASTIRQFADTERAKYPAKYSAPTEGPIFSDAVLERYCDFTVPSVTTRTQTVEKWLARVHYTNGDTSQPTYHTSHGDLADVVKVLLAENELDTLLMLAQHPRIPLRDLHSLSWGHSFGWDHVRDWALWAYLFFNVLLSKPELIADGRYKSMNSYKSVVCFVTGTGDYDAQAYPHREFFWGTMNRYVSHDAVDPLSDFDKLNEYLKMCFRLLYRYDMLARECGLPVDWETAIASTVRYMWKVKVEYKEDEQGRWVTRFA